jgi:PTS system glucitol/sorbitol-specific IIA component
MSAARYETTVTAVGPLVAELLVGGRLILFGLEAPAELHELCALHGPATSAAPVQPGDVVRIGTDELTVRAVGDVANANLESLGHVTLREASTTTDPLPGEITVDGALPAGIEPGTTILIEGGNHA